MNYYEVLGVDIYTAQDVIKDAYMWSFDIELDEIEDNDFIPLEKLNLINEAFLVLTDPVLKREYDCNLEGIEYDGNSYNFDVGDEFDYSIHEYNKFIEWLHLKMHRIESLFGNKDNALFSKVLSDMNIIEEKICNIISVSKKVKVY